MQKTDSQNIIPVSDPHWMEFIQSHPDATIFHHPAWLELMCECYGYTPSIFAVTDLDGNIRAGLPLVKVKSLLRGTRLVSMPFSDYCYPLYEDESVCNEFSRQLVRKFRTENINHLEVRWSLSEHSQIQKVSKFVLHTIQLDSDPNKVFKQFKRTHRQNIFTAEKRGVKVEFGNRLEHLKIFYKLQLETRKRHGVPAQPWKYFALLWRYIINSNMGFTLLALKDDQYIAGMVYLNWGKTLIAKYAASREDSFNLKPNNLLFWEGMRWGCQNGYQVFDMGRTELENKGLRNFKCRWGAKEEPLIYSILSSKLLKPSSGRLDRLLHLIIQRSPLWVCRLSGDALYKYFG